MASIKYYVLDLETTGTSVSWHEVTQISIIRCADRNQLNKYIKAEFPQRASPEALKYTNRTMADLYKGDSKKDVIQMCNEFFAQDDSEPEERCIVGHSIWNFDRRFLHSMWGSVGEEFPANLWLDTIPYFKAFVKKKGLTERKYNLTKACEVVGLKPKSGAHNAVVDTQNNYRLWVALKEKHGIPSLTHIKREAHKLE